MKRVYCNLINGDKNYLQSELPLGGHKNKRLPKNYSINQIQLRRQLTFRCGAMDWGVCRLNAQSKRRNLYVRLECYQRTSETRKQLR